MSAAVRLEVAREQVTAMTAQKLDYYSDSDKLWHLAQQVGVAFYKLERLIKRERFRRGIVKLADLPPHERREMVVENGIDLHAIAAGPIMDAAKIYLPAGKLSLAETKAREAPQILQGETHGRG